MWPIPSTLKTLPSTKNLRKPTYGDHYRHQCLRWRVNLRYQWIFHTFIPLPPTFPTKVFNSVTYASYEAVPSFIFSQRTRSNLSPGEKKPLHHKKCIKQQHSDLHFIFAAFMEGIFRRSIHLQNQSIPELLSADKGELCKLPCCFSLTQGCAPIVMDFYFDATRTVCFMTCSLKLIVMAAILLMALRIMTFEGRRTEKRCKAINKSVDFQIYCSSSSACSFTLRSLNTKAFESVFCACQHKTTLIPAFTLSRLQEN